MDRPGKKAIEVVCAVIIENGKLLAACRGHGMDLSMKWELPGGKVENNETLTHAAARELKEELGIEVSVIEEAEAIVHDYGTKIIRLVPVIAEIISGQACAEEHHEIRWVTPDEALELDWAEADLRLLGRIGEKLKQYGFEKNQD